MNAPDDLKDLTRVLEEELRIYRAMSECLLRKRDALVKLDRQRVHALGRELDTLITEVRRVSEARAGMVQRIGRSLGCRGDSLRELLAAAPEPHRSRFGELRKSLLDEAKSVQRHAGICKTLIGDALGQVRTFVRMLAGLANPGPVYPNPRLGSQAPALVDQQA